MFPALAITYKAPVHREQEATQTLLVPMASTDLGEKPESAAFLILNNDTLILFSQKKLLCAGNKCGENAEAEC